MPRGYPGRPTARSPRSPAARRSGPPSAPPSSSRAEHDGERTRELLAEALAYTERSNRELRELAHGILPPVLSHGALRIAVRDDGIGGADPEGHGLLGVRDRVAALGGRLEIDSVSGSGTLLVAELAL